MKTALVINIYTVTQNAMEAIPYRVNIVQIFSKFENNSDNNFHNILCMGDAIISPCEIDEFLTLEYARRFFSGVEVWVL